jgi:hypothetical protein
LIIAILAFYRTSLPISLSFPLYHDCRISLKISVDASLFNEPGSE